MFRLTQYINALLFNTLYKKRVVNFRELLFIVTFLFYFFPTFSQIKVSVDTTEIRIGEQFEYELSTALKSNVFFPELQLDSAKKIEIVHKFPLDTIKNRLYKKYLLTSFDSGTYWIPRQKIIIDNEHYFTDSLLIQVGTVAVDTTKQGLYPIKPIYQAPPKTWHEYMYLLWWLLGIALLLGIIWWMAFRHKNIISWKPKKERSPFDIALDQLKSLDAKNLLIQQKIKEYYTELTDIVRNYIEKDLNISAMETTSDELILLFKKTNKYKKLGIPKDKIENLQKFLQNADLVKFAKGIPDSKEIQSDRIHAETLVNEIKAATGNTQSESDILELQKVVNQQKTSRKRKIWAIGIGMAVLMLVLGSTLWYYGIKYVKDTVIGHPTKELLEKKWFRSSYGYPAISLESPMILKPLDINPFQGNTEVVSFSNHSYGSLMNGFNITVMTIELQPETTFSLENAVQGAVLMIQSTQGVSDFKYDTNNVQKNKIEGKEIIGTLKINNQSSIYHHFIYQTENQIQQIIVSRKTDDEYAQKIEKRLLASVQLDRISNNDN